MQTRIEEQQKQLAQKDQLIQRLNTQIKELTTTEYTEYKGACFQKKPGGGYREAIFGLVCKSPMTPTATRTHFTCLKCGHHAEFPGQAVADIIRDIPR